MSGSVAYMRAGIYTRLSRVTDESTSIDRQVVATRAAAENKDAEVVIEESDTDISGQKFTRPGLQRILKNLDKIDLLIVWKIDRLARSVRDLSNIVETLKQHDVSLVSATEPFDTTNYAGRMMVQLLGIFAELEAQVIADRMKSSNAKLRELGRARGGKTSYPWHTVPNPDGPGFVLELHPERGPLTRDIISRVIDGASITGICRDLESQGIPAPGNGETWHPKTLIKLLRSKRLLGYTMFDGQILRGEDGLPRRDRPAVIDPATWDQLQETLDSRHNPGGGGSAKPTGLLVGVLTCAECGAVMYMSQSKGDKTYRCYSSVRTPKKKCPGVSVSARLLDHYIEEWFLSRFNGVTASWNTVNDSGEEVEIVNDALDDVRRALSDLEKDRYERRLFPGDAGAKRYADLYLRLLDRQSALEAEAREMEEAEAEADVNISSRPLNEVWLSADTDLRRELLRAVLESLTIRKGTSGKRGLDQDRVALTVYSDYLLRVARMIPDIE